MLPSAPGFLSIAEYVTQVKSSSKLPILCRAMCKEQQHSSKIEIKFRRLKNHLLGPVLIRTSRQGTSRQNKSEILSRLSPVTYKLGRRQWPLHRRLPSLRFRCDRRLSQRRRMEAAKDITDLHKDSRTEQFFLKF
jgi:hypothetical protein